MEARVHLITLGVDDLDRAEAFYRALGWVPVLGAPPEMRVFNLLGAVLGLYPADRLAEEAGVSRTGPGTVSLSCNQPDAAAVDTVMAQAEQAGAEITRAAQPTHWGGYGGYFCDPDGHLWEVAHNPFVPLSTEGGFQWPTG